MAKLSDAELLGAISAAEEAALGTIQGDIASDRADAIDRYLGKAYGDEQVGRSQVVSRDVADVVEGVLANVLKPFVSGDRIVQFDPRGPEDEEQAQQETDYVNFIALERNNGFLVLNAAVKDALLLRNGYVKMGWTKRDDVLLERYEALSDDELAILLQDKEVQVVEHSEYPDPMFAQPPMPAAEAMSMGQGPMSPPPAPNLHDVRVRRMRPTEYVETLPCPPDEILVSERSTSPSLQMADFVQHRRKITLSDVRAAGYDVEDDINDDDRGSSLEDFSRQRFGDFDSDIDNTGDPARRLVLFKETWIRIDRDGDGTAELRRVCSIGESILADEETEFIPIACFTGTLMPHQHLGISTYDMVQDLARLKTALLRQFMDNKYLANNSRNAVDVNLVNLDDLLVSRPGGIVRVQGNPMNAVMPLTAVDTGASALQGLEYLDTIRENRTGFTRYAQGMDSDSLVNKTATGLMQATSQSQMRLEMVSRTIAETGVRDMFRIIHALTLKHSTREEKVRLRNKWVAVNPREWVRRTDLSISVGIGTGTPDQMMQKLMALLPVQQQAMQMGLAGPQEAYNFGTELWKAAGFKNPDKFLKPPEQEPVLDPQGQPVMGEDGKPKTKAKAPQPSPPPEVLAAKEMAQGQIQTEQIKQQGAGKKAQLDAQVAMAKCAKEDETERYRILVDAAVKLLISRREHEEAMADQAHQQQNAAEDRMVAIRDADENRNLTRESAQVQGEQKVQKQKNDLAPMMQAIQLLVNTLNAPKEIVRGPDGRATGVRTVQ